MTTHFLTVNPFSRPGKRLYSVSGLVWHWIANPGTSPEQNRDFFESRKEGRNGYGSAHYIVGIDGEILQCIPEVEMAYHVGAESYNPEAVAKFGPYPNATTLGIELCHPDWTGAFTQATLDALSSLSADLCKRYALRPCTDIVRHFDVTGKDCPKWFVAHNKEYEIQKERIKEILYGLS